MPKDKVRVGILGCGSIGGFLARNALADRAIDLAYVYDLDESRMQEIPQACRVTKQQELFTRPADLVVEAAHADLVKAVALALVERSDLLLFSVTSLADDSFRESLKRRAIECGHRVYLPHGAIAGVDGLVDAGQTLELVTVTTTKHPKSLGLAPDTNKIVYEGPTREACARFPRNVNVHATIALAGLGFDRTTSRIVADPSVNTNSHVIEVQGTGYHFRIEISSESGGKVSGAYTPISAWQTLKRICTHEGGMRFA